MGEAATIGPSTRINHKGGEPIKQRAHAWVALRAFKMIDDWGNAPKLTEMLSYYLSDVWNGAWLPDTRIVDMRYGHIFKMDSDPAFIYPELPNEKWLIKSAEDLSKVLAGERSCIAYVTDSEELKKPYRDRPKDSGHLPNRVLALAHTIADMLKLSDFPLGAYAQKKKVKDASNVTIDLSAQKVADLSKSPNFSARQIALTFFLLSHYVCDAHMPLHCDLRDLSLSEKPSLKRRLPENLHPWIEQYWEENFPLKQDLILTEYTKDTLDEIVVDKIPKGSMIAVDRDPKYSMGKKVDSGLKGDEWNEMIYTTRLSYAVARKWIPTDVDWLKLLPGDYNKFRKSVSNKELGGTFSEDFVDVTNRIFQDAVRSVAAIWNNAWTRFVE
jgi:hypothetical protein